MTDHAWVADGAGITYCEDCLAFWVDDVGGRCLGRPRCYIDDCPNTATLHRHSYPDNVRLCDEHRHLDDGEVG